MNACNVYDGVCIPPSKLSVVGCHGGERQPIIDTRKLVIGTCKSIIGTCNSIIGTCKSIIDTCGPHPPNSPTFRSVCSCIHTKRSSLHASVESDSDDAPRQCAQAIIALRTYRHVTRSSVCVLNLRGYVRRRGAHMIQNMLAVRRTAHMGWT